MESTPSSGAAAAAPGAARVTGIRKRVGLALELSCISLVMSAVAVACLQVVMRYVFRSALPWPEDVATWVFAWAVKLGMALATGRGVHIAIDVLPWMPAPWARAVLMFLISVTMVTVSIVLLVHGMDFVRRSIAASPALQLPVKYLFLAVPVGAAFNLFFLFWPDGRRGFLYGAATLACRALAYWAIRSDAGALYTQASGPWVLVGAGIGAIMLGVPVAFALLLGACAAFASANPILLVTISQNMGASLNSFTLLAIPFFILAAAVMNAGGFIRVDWFTPEGLPT